MSNKTCENRMFYWTIPDGIHITEKKPLKYFSLIEHNMNLYIILQYILLGLKPRTSVMMMTNDYRCVMHGPVLGLW